MTNPIDAIVEVKKLWTVFQNGAKESVIQEPDLTVQRGEIMSLVGVSGTANRAVSATLGLEKPTATSPYMKPCRRAEPARRRQPVIMLRQALFRSTVP
jgi:ABC-type dipeptide/oligopeptide/nickel transport system ATPase subunit